MDADLTILITNYNTSRFLELSLAAIHALTESPYTVLINDNGSGQADLSILRHLERRYPLVKVFYRRSDKTGSPAHGEALDFLVSHVRTPLTAVLDSDCTPLMKGWDRYLAGQLSDEVKIAGSPLGAGWSHHKPSDFPFQFLVVFDTDTYRRLGISASPRNLEAGEDTCWEWKPKFTGAGYSARCLKAVNTRFDARGPLGSVLCVEYYTEDGRLLGSHFGRGSTRQKRPTKPSLVWRVKNLLFDEAHRAWKRQRAEWIRLCEQLIEREVRAAPRA